MKASILKVTILLVTVLCLSGAAQHQWGFNADTGDGGASKPDVMRALGVNRLTFEEADALVFTCIDTVDGCLRERRLRTTVRTGGNDAKVTGFWFFGYETNGGVCGSGAAGSDAALYVNGIPIR